MMVEKIMVNTSLGAKGALAHGLQCLTVGLIQNGRRGLEIGQTLGYWTPPKNLLYIFCFDSIIPSMRTSKFQNCRPGGPQNG